MCSFAQNDQTFSVQTAQFFDISKPLTDMTPQSTDVYEEWEDGIVKNGFRYVTGNGPKSPVNDPSWQKKQGNISSKAPLVNFEGSNNGNNTGGVAPPDTQGDVGLNYYVQMVNGVTQIFDKSGTTVYGPTNNSAFWNGFNGSWTGTNDGDPIVLYDQAAGRWLVSQFAVNTGDGTQWELIAISTTSNPTGSYYRYAYQFTDMPDYPKLGVWPDGYYMAANRFTTSSGAFNGTYAAVFDRSQMLIGNAGATMQLFQNSSSTEPYSMLPSDCDGTFPATGTPNYFCYDTDNIRGLDCRQNKGMGFSYRLDNTCEFYLHTTFIADPHEFQLKLLIGRCHRPARNFSEPGHPCRQDDVPCTVP